jgi:hypothetical protein
MALTGLICRLTGYLLRKIFRKSMCEIEAKKIGEGDAFLHWTEISVETFPVYASL